MTTTTLFTLCQHTFIIALCVVMFLLFLTQVRFIVEQLRDRALVSVLSDSYHFSKHYLIFFFTWITSTLTGATVVAFALLFIVVLQIVSLTARIYMLALLLVVVLGIILYESVHTRSRKLALEYIDLGPEKGDFTLQEYYENMSQIEKVCEMTAADFSILSQVGFDRFTFDFGELKTVLDVGCGGGWLCFALNKKYPDAKITGIEINEHAVNYANSRKLEMIRKTGNSDLNNIEFRKIDHVDLREPPLSVDVVCCSLVLHHIEKEQDLIHFLKTAGIVAEKAVIINELERDPIAAFAFKLFMFPLFSNKLTRNDGLLSVRRSFTKSELVGYLRAAGYRDEQFSVQWCPINRFTIYIKLR